MITTGGRRIKSYQPIVCDFRVIPTAISSPIRQWHRCGPHADDPGCDHLLPSPIGGILHIPAAGKPCLTTVREVSDVTGVAEGGDPTPVPDCAVDGRAMGTPGLPSDGDEADERVAAPGPVALQVMAVADPATSCP